MSQVHKFLKHAGKHLQKKAEITAARQSYRQQIQKIQRIPKPAPLTHALKELEKKVDHLVQTEQSIIRYETTNARHDEILKAKIEQIESRLNEYARTTHLRSDRLNKLESRIRTTLGIPQQVENLRGQIDNLRKKEDTKHQELQKKDKIIDDKVEGIKKGLKSVNTRIKQTRSARVNELERKINKKLKRKKKL